MIRMYSDEDLWEAMRQKRRILSVFWAVTAAYFFGLAALIVYYVSLPYADPNGTWVIWVASIITALYLFFVFPYMGISFKRSRAYCKMLCYISAGLKEYADLPFSEIDNWITHDGVDVNVAVFLIPNAKKNEPMNRQIYVDGEKDFPPFREGARARMILQGNLLIEYEIDAPAPAEGVQGE